jgi:hypothetical protein
MKRVCALALLLFLLVIASCSSSDGPRHAIGNKWTLMIYLDADNNLESWSRRDLREMEEIGSTGNVTVIVQHDTNGDTTKRYKVETGSLTLLEDLGELDMADGATLQNFVYSTALAYPADHYALIIWNHGQGWKGSTRAGVAGSKSIFSDYDNGKYYVSLSNRDVALALVAAESAAGIKLDILGVDACNMSLIEAAYEFRSVADILVASQDIVAVEGWDYDDLLARLVSNPLMTPVDLSRGMVDSFRMYYDNSDYTDQTIAALALNMKYSSDGTADIGTLAGAVNDLALRLSARMADSGTRDATLALITNSRMYVEEFDNINVDLVDFSFLIEGDNSPVELEFNKLLLDEYHGSDRNYAYGLSIVFFDRSSPLDEYVYDPSYRNYNPDTQTGSRIAFINDFNWDEMMHTYFSLQYPDKPN